MQKLKTPIIISNWKSNPKSLTEAKKILERLDKEFSFLKKKNKKNKSLNFLLSLPSPFIYPIQEFLKEKKNKNLKNILLGAQNFDEIESSNKNNSISLTQLKSIGSQFVILNDSDIFENEENKKQKEGESDKKNSKTEANLILLERLNGISKRADSQAKEENLKKIDNKKNNSFTKTIEKLEEKLKAALENGMISIFFIKEKDLEEFKNITDIIKKIIKNIHYNLFDKLIICYEPSHEFSKLEQTNMEDCLEKTIAIRRSVANMFGIDSAKKIKIVYSGKIDENNVKEILKNGGVDGVFVNEESLAPEILAKIVYTIK